MCGILFRATKTHSWDGLFEELIPVVTKRGPTSHDSVSRTVAEYDLTFFSSVLSLRHPFAAQPVVKDNKVLQFNGELYNDNFEENDTLHFFESIQRSGVVKTLKWARGEYAFVYYDGEGTIWFSRDCIGRRSLLFGQQKGGLLISSVSLGHSELQEVPGGSIMKFSVQTGRIEELAWGKDFERPFGAVSRQVSGANMVDTFENELVKAVSKRLVTIPDDDTQVAILFSGGLDCTLLASIVDQLLAPHKRVDLLNVAFENVRTGGGYNTPDRKLARHSWHELNSPRFRLVEIDVPFSETLKHRPHVQQLMYPKDSVMDLSISVAFYFASRGEGKAYDSFDSEPYGYTSNCKVLFSGLGADELFGGYSRHCRQLENGYDSLAAELQLDFDRLHERNLGRDDRVCTIWGKEMRYPFLDETVVQTAMDAPLDQKVPNDQETKHLLRKIALRRQLPKVALEKKRAIQFGAKSAKMEMGDGRTKGHEKLTLKNHQLN